MKTVKDNTLRRRILILIVLLYTLCGAAACFFTGKLNFPAPLVETVVLTRALLVKETSNWYAVASAVFLLFSVVAMCISVVAGKKNRFLTAGLCITFVFDLLIHLYCFFVASGFQWIYFFNILCDVFSVLIFLLPDRISGRRRR